MKEARITRSNLHGLEIDHIDIPGGRITCIPDPASVPWNYSSLLPSVTPGMFDSACSQLPATTIDEASKSINISFNTFVIDLNGTTILIDAGVGNGKTRPDRPSWHHRSGPFLDILKEVGFQPNSIDIVFNTHLHADHVGWNTILENDHWVPTFPNAKYLTSSEELSYWISEFSLDPATSFGSYADSVAPLIKENLFKGVPSNAVLAPGISLEPVPGHTYGMCAIRVQSGGVDVYLLADVIHHPIQFLYPDVCSRACVDFSAARSSRHRILDSCHRLEAIVATTHFPGSPFGNVLKRGLGFSFHSLPISGA